MEYFGVSDVHGNLSILKSSLINSGFVPNSSYHFLIHCGDCFDRGAENKELYEYLNTISNKIIIRGNHEEMLMNAIRCGYISVADMYNGTETTMENLFGFDSIDKRGIELLYAVGELSTSLLQRSFKIGYGKAAAMIDSLIEKEIVFIENQNGRIKYKTLLEYEEAKAKL